MRWRPWPMIGLVAVLVGGFGAEEAMSQGARLPAAPPAAGGQAQPPRPGGLLGSVDRDQPVTIDADRLEAFQKESLVIFAGNVVARQGGSVQHAERMEVYLAPNGERILRMVSTGGVRIVTRDCRMGTARRAEYDATEDRVLLIGDARVWQDDNVITGERITVYLSEERSIVESGGRERVKAVFHPRREDATGAAAARPRPPAGAPCS